MHPDVCRFISDEVYEGRLSSHASCALQTTGAGTGIRYLPVEHTGNGSQSPEEADRIACSDRRARGHGDDRPVRASRARSRPPTSWSSRRTTHRSGCFTSGCRTDVRVGTVDAFQGQEAPVVIFSMATSSGEDVPRGIAFLFSRNRLNVAISRARSLAYLCCAPGLLEARARTVDEMRLISTLCSLVETAGHPGLGPAGSR